MIKEQASGERENDGRTSSPPGITQDCRGGSMNAGGGRGDVPRARPFEKGSFIVRTPRNNLSFRDRLNPCRSRSLSVRAFQGSKLEPSRRSSHPVDGWRPVASPRNPGTIHSLNRRPNSRQDGRNDVFAGNRCTGFRNKLVAPIGSLPPAVPIGISLQHRQVMSFRFHVSRTARYFSAYSRPYSCGHML